PCIQVGYQRAVGQAEIAPPVQSEDGAGLCTFRLADLGTPVRRRFAIGQIQNADLCALSFEQEDCASRAQLRIIGMRRDYQVIEKWQRNIVCCDGRLYGDEYLARSP